MDRYDQSKERLHAEVAQLRKEKAELEVRLHDQPDAAAEAARSQGFLEAVFNAIDDAISIISVPDLTITATNYAFDREYEAGGAAAVGRKCYEVTHGLESPCEGPHHLCPLWEAVRTGNRETVEHVHRRPNGQTFFAEITAYPVLDDDGKAVQVVHASRDVTERKLAQEKLAERAEELSAANESLSQYAHIVSHDLRAPLRAIRQYSEFLAEDLGDLQNEDVAEYLGSLGDAVRQADDLVSGLLCLTRTGRKSLAADEIDLDRLVWEVLAGFEIGQDVVARVARGWPTITGDRLLLAQVLQNLVSNAVKFNESTPKILTIDFEELEGKLVLRVADNGIGIDPRYQERIFEAFERLHHDDEYPGSGLGLAIARKSVTKMGGELALQSEPGKGSTFTITLSV